MLACWCFHSFQHECGQVPFYSSRRNKLDPAKKKNPARPVALSFLFLSLALNGRCVPATECWSFLSGDSPHAAALSETGPLPRQRRRQKTCSRGTPCGARAGGIWVRHRTFADSETNRSGNYDSETKAVRFRNQMVRIRNQMSRFRNQTADSETKTADSETKSDDSETKPGDSATTFQKPKQPMQKPSQTIQKQSPTMVAMGWRARGVWGGGAP